MTVLAALPPYSREETPHMYPNRPGTPRRNSDIFLSMRHRMIPEVQRTLRDPQIAAPQQPDEHEPEPEDATAEPAE